MTPAETAIRAALAAGPTPSVWHTKEDRLHDACTPYALAELLAELDRLRGEREPLTKEQIMTCFDEAALDYVNLSDAEMIDFARAIEKRHGIGD